MRHRNAVLFALAAIAGLPLAANPQTQPALYTAQQAESGEALFAGKCAQCHGDRFRAGPPLTGSRVTVGAIFQHATRHMPMQNALALTDDQYVRIMAAILEQNGFPAGSTPLTYATAFRSTVPFPVAAPPSVPRR
ncbi:MAG TPA: cytochrome c [Candidatus Limnocylindria bacterium]|jgi:polar amino acid transport system substrate-binding protein|nr:cytochrome c [Candidatus Limnocylindria bacterium]